MRLRLKVRLSSNSAGVRPRRSVSDRVDGRPPRTHFHPRGRSWLASLPVGLTAVEDPGNRDGVLVVMFKEEAIVAAGEAETGQGLLQRLQVACAVFQIAGEAVKNLEGSVAVDGAQIGSCLGRPSNAGPAEERFVRASVQAELAQDLFVRNAFTASQRSAGPVECRGCFRRDLFVFDRRQSK